jgi:hypothetical protein
LALKERRELERRNREAVARIHAERVARGTCRHCDGPLPCWSPFGDRAVGKRHTAASLKRSRAS